MKEQTLDSCTTGFKSQLCHSLCTLGQYCLSGFMCIQQCPQSLPCYKCEKILMKQLAQSTCSKGKKLTRKKPRKHMSLRSLTPHLLVGREAVHAELWLRNVCSHLAGLHWGMCRPVAMDTHVENCSFCISQASLDVGVSEASKVGYQTDASLLLLSREQSWNEGREDSR